MDRALAFDVSHPGRHRIPGRKRDHDVYMVGEKMAHIDATFLLFGQFSEYFAQMLPQFSIQHLSAAFRDKNNIVLALPFQVA
jgi:hypothetical protein